MIKFTVKNPETWTQEHFEEFFKNHFQDPIYTLDECSDAWDGNIEVDANVYQDEEKGTYHCWIYKVYIDKNGFESTDTSWSLACCDLDIEEI